MVILTFASALSLIYSAAYAVYVLKHKKYGAFIVLCALLLCAVLAMMMLVML